MKKKNVKKLLKSRTEAWFLAAERLAANRHLTTDLEQQQALTMAYRMALNDLVLFAREIPGYENSALTSKARFVIGRATDGGDKRDDSDPEPCAYCVTAGREWTPECEENKSNLVFGPPIALVEASRNQTLPPLPPPPPVVKEPAIEEKGR